VAENKTKPTKQSVTAFINSVDDKQQRADIRKIAAIMRKVTGSRATMWGDSIVGFGQYHYTYASGREGDFLITGFSPRKSSISIYIMGGFGRMSALMKKLGKFKTGKSCLYVKRLADVDGDVLEEVISRSVRYMRDTYTTQ
jgi:hypothetical protein